MIMSLPFSLYIAKPFGKGQRRFHRSGLSVQSSMIIDSRASATGVNGGATSPMLRSPSSMSASRPTVDSLLEELSTAVPNG